MTEAPAEPPRLAQLRRALTEGAPFCPYDTHLGIRMTHVERGASRMEIDVDATFHNPAGRIHGGLISSLADSAFGAAMVSLLDPGESCTNTDLNMRFLRRVDGTRLVAEARVSKEGRRVTFLDCDVWDGDRLVAKATSTFLRLPPRTTVRSDADS